jgi:hypothetical protein
VLRLNLVICWRGLGRCFLEPVISPGFAADLFWRPCRVAGKFRYGSLPNGSIMFFGNESGLKEREK